MVLSSDQLAQWYIKVEVGHYRAVSGTMKRLCLVYWVLAASAVLSEGQTNICFPEVCFHPSEYETTNEKPNNLESQIVQARCNSACREDVSCSTLE